MATQQMNPFYLLQNPLVRNPMVSNILPTSMPILNSISNNSSPEAIREAYCFTLSVKASFDPVSRRFFALLKNLPLLEIVQPATIFAGNKSRALLPVVNDGSGNLKVLGIRDTYIQFENCSTLLYHSGFGTREPWFAI